MKKISALQVISVLIIIGAIALGFFISNKNTGTTETATTQIESTGSETTMADSGSDSLYEMEQKRLQEKMDAYAFYNSAVDSLDMTVCDKILNDDTLKTECLDNVYSAKASKEKNAALCEKIQNTAIKARCMSSFAYDTAIASGKQSDCDKITGDDDLKKACMKNIVFARIEDQSFSGTVDTCASLSGADKEYCIGRIEKGADIELLQKWTNTKDIAICWQITDTGMRNTCNDTVYMTLAMEKQDGSLCAKITDTNRKTNCINQFARVNDANILSKALSENSLPLCATITASDLKMKCTDTLLLKTGVANKDATLCAKISDAGVRKQCSDAVNLILEQVNKQK